MDTLTGTIQASSLKIGALPRALFSYVELPSRRLNRRQSEMAGSGKRPARGAIPRYTHTAAGALDGISLDEGTEILPHAYIRAAQEPLALHDPAPER